MCDEFEIVLIVPRLTARMHIDPEFCVILVPLLLLQM